jgi:branched-chain amino acid transport system ATP-binding protein
MAEQLLRVEGLKAGYGEAVVLNGISLALPAGESLALLGRNGTGKTTLINTLVGVTRRHAGRLWLGEHEITALAPFQRAERHRLGAAGAQHLQVADRRGEPDAVARPGRWDVKRVYEMFPRLAERRGNMGTQLSGGDTDAAHARWCSTCERF